MADKPTCSILGCCKAVFARGWCTSHYFRWKRNGDALAGHSSPGAAIAWLDELVERVGTDDCVFWQFKPRTRDGYGQVSFNGKVMGAHRYVCIASHGEPPKGKNEAAHICGKGRQGCVNPRPLHWASRAENHAEGAKLRGSGVAPLYRTSKIPNHDIQTIRSMRGNERIAVTAARYGVHESTISLIQSGKRRSQA